MTKINYKFGIRMVVSSIQTSFSMPIPNYVPEIQLGDNKYLGWTLTIIEEVKGYKKSQRRLVAQKNINASYYSPFVEAMWMRMEIQKAFRQFSPRKRFIYKENSFYSSTVHKIKFDENELLNKEKHGCE